ncbi:MAG: XdhC family protein [Steroidobacteraceae bacterium]|jgi:xanthine dehydrogenase accessory factor
MTTEDLAEMARELNGRSESYALVTVVRAVAPSSAYPGAQAIILADGKLHGWIGGGCARDLVISAAKAAIEKGEPKLVRISNDKIYAEEDIEHYRMSCASNGSIELFIQPNNLSNALCVLGSTPAADEARFLAQRLRIRLTELPGDAPVVLVATQGQGDEAALEAALRSSAKQVLMIASRRKAEHLQAAMRMRGVDATQLARLQAPAGPDVGAKTPAEIALVAIAGVLATLRGRKTRELPAERVEPTVTVPAADVAGNFLNPVCGASVRIAEALHVEVVAGVEYYFCCDGCWKTFLEDPQKYAAIHSRSAAATAAQSPFGATSFPDKLI